MGAWSFVHEFIAEVAESLGFRDPEPTYAGRMTAASPATGLARVHAEQQAALVAGAFEIGRPRVRRTAARRDHQERTAARRRNTARKKEK